MYKLLRGSEGLPLRRGNVWQERKNRRGDSASARPVFSLIFRDQKSKRNPSWISRELPFMLVICPADAEPRLEIGKLKLGWLNRLKKSARICILLPSVTRKLFCNEKSKSV